MKWNSDYSHDSAWDEVIADKRFFRECRPANSAELGNGHYYIHRHYKTIWVIVRDDGEEMVAKRIKMAYRRGRERMYRLRKGRTGRMIISENEVHAIAYGPKPERVSFFPLLNYEVWIPFDENRLHKFSVQWDPQDRKVVFTPMDEIKRKKKAHEDLFEV